MATKEQRIEKALLKWGYTEKVSEGSHEKYWECPLGDRGTIQVDVIDSQLTIHIRNKGIKKFQSHTVMFKSLKGVHFPTTARWLSRQLQKAYFESDLHANGYEEAVR